MATMKFYTYPEYSYRDENGEYRENEDYDTTLKEFEVPYDWAVDWIALWAVETGLSADSFMDEYTWDDTLEMYDDAYPDGKVITEKIIERSF